MNHSISHEKFQAICANALDTLNVPNGVFEDRIEHSAQVLLLWAFKGFPDTPDKDIYRFVRAWYSVVLEWLFPHHLKGHRTHKYAWKLACLLSNTIGLHDLWLYDSKIHMFRVMLRAFGLDIQKTILQKNASSKPWGKYLSHVFKSIFHPQLVNRESACYFAWCQHQQRWYVGKANLIRNKKRDLDSLCTSAGSVGRFQDHVISTRSKGGKLHTETRYREWKMPIRLNSVLSCFVGRLKMRF